MALISIKLKKYSLRYYSLKQTHKNGQNFWNNLIIYKNVLKMKIQKIYYKSKQVMFNYKFLYELSNLEEKIC